MEPIELVPSATATALDEAVVILTRAELKALSGETRSYVTSAMHTVKEAIFLRPRHAIGLLRAAQSMIEHASDVEIGHRRGELNLARAGAVIAGAVVELEIVLLPQKLRERYSTVELEASAAYQLPRAA